MPDRKLPAQHNFYFTQDLEITESLIPYVKVSLMINPIDNEEIFHYVDEEKKYRYKDCWYVYGDNDLLYVGGLKRYDWRWDEEEGQSYYTDYARITSEFWRAKYIIGDYIYWTNSTDFWLNWTDIGDDGNFKIVLPFKMQGSEYYTLPYSKITVKRNTGETLANVDGINSDYDIPSYTYIDSDGNEVTNYRYSFPNLELDTSFPVTSCASIRKYWTKLNDNKYKLKVCGSILKTAKGIKEVEEYEQSTLVYNATYYRYGDNYVSNYAYDNGASSIDTKEVDLYKGHPTQSKLKLLISFINKKNYREHRVIELNEV